MTCFSHVQLGRGPRTESSEIIALSWQYWEYFTVPLKMRDVRHLWLDLEAAENKKKYRQRSYFLVKHILRVSSSCHEPKATSYSPLNTEALLSELKRCQRETQICAAMTEAVCPPCQSELDALGGKHSRPGRFQKAKQQL